MSLSTASAPVSATLVPGKQSGEEEGDQTEAEMAVDQEEEGGARRGEKR